MSNLNIIKPNPSLRDVLDMYRRDVMLSLNCHALATVQSFDSDRQVVTATINYPRTFVATGPNGSTTERNVPYPILQDCPVVILGGGPCSLTFPIAEGDQCLILFNDRDIDNWFTDRGGPATTLATNRLHSFSDAIALVGLDLVDGYDTVRALLTNGNVKVGINPGNDKATIANALYTLNGLLQELVTELMMLVTQTAAITVTAVTPGVGVSGPPANAAAIAAVSAQLAATAVKLGVLLE